MLSGAKRPTLHPLAQSPDFNEGRWAATTKATTVADPSGTDASAAGSTAAATLAASCEAE
jgi:hypothetical protein